MLPQPWREHAGPTAERPAQHLPGPGVRLQAVLRGPVANAARLRATADRAEGAGRQPSEVQLHDRVADRRAAEHQAVRRDVLLAAGDALEIRIRQLALGRRVRDDD